MVRRRRRFSSSFLGFTVITALRLHARWAAVAAAAPAPSPPAAGAVVTVRCRPAARASHVAGRAGRRTER